jgi:hypothetical protein
VTESPEIPRKPRSRPFLALSFVVACVAFVSFLPVRGKRALHTEGHLHVGLHLTVFALVAFVASRAAGSRTARIAAFAGAILFGFLIEEGEHFVYGGGMEWKDVLADTVGAIAGTLLALASLPGKSGSEQGAD